MAEDNAEEILDELNRLNAAWQAAKTQTPKDALMPDATYHLVVSYYKLDKSPGTGTLRYSLKLTVNMPDSPWHNKDFWHKWYLTENTFTYVKRDFALIGFTIKAFPELFSLNPKGAEFDAFVSWEEYDDKNSPPNPDGSMVKRRKNVVKYFKDRPAHGGHAPAAGAQGPSPAGSPETEDPW